MSAGQLRGIDREILHFLGRFGVATVDQVHRELMPGKNKRTAYRRLEVLKQHKYVRFETVFYRKPGVWWASPEGLNFAGIDGKPYRLSKPILEHTIELVNLYQEIHESGERYLYYTAERELRHRARSRPIPDALLTFPSGEFVALELELSDKRTLRYQELLAAYARNDVLSGVRWYFARIGGLERVRKLARKAEERHGRRDGFFEFFRYLPEGYFSDSPRLKDGESRILQAPPPATMPDSDGLPF